MSFFLARCKTCNMQIRLAGPSRESVLNDLRFRNICHDGNHAAFPTLRAHIDETSLREVSFGVFLARDVEFESKPRFFRALFTTIRGCPPTKDFIAAELAAREKEEKSVPQH